MLVATTITDEYAVMKRIKCLNVIRGQSPLSFEGFFGEIPKE